MRRYRTFILMICLALAGTACDVLSGSTEPNVDARYEIVHGVCGTLTYQGRIGIDDEMALRVLEAQKREQYTGVELDVFEITVVDENGDVPNPSFYAVRVVDRSSGHIVHGLHEVITSNGALYHIQWCPD